MAVTLFRMAVKPALRFGEDDADAVVVVGGHIGEVGDDGRVVGSDGDAERLQAEQRGGGRRVLDGQIEGPEPESMPMPPPSCRLALTLLIMPTPVACDNEMPPPVLLIRFK